MPLSVLHRILGAAILCSLHLSYVWAQDVVVNGAGNLDSGATTQNITGLDAAATGQNVVLAGNDAPGIENTTFGDIAMLAALASNVTVTDSLNAQHTLSLVCFKIAALQFVCRVYVTSEDVDTGAPAIGFPRQVVIDGGADQDDGSVSLQFSVVGIRQSFTLPDITLEVPWNNGADPSDIELNFDPFTSFSTSSSISTVVDSCTADPDKTEPGQCGCGNSDADADGDGTANCVDNCAQDSNKTEPGVCGCGVSDSDTDSDGTLDCNDECAMDPAKVAPAACGCGVADTDNDEDGSLDCDETCDDDVSKTAPGICGCGVPDVDADNDLIFDCDDACPSDAGKSAPGDCGCGASDEDVNGNGFSDCLDPAADFRPGLPTVKVTNRTVTLSLETWPTSVSYRLQLRYRRRKARRRKKRTQSSEGSMAVLEKLRPGFWDVRYRMESGDGTDTTTTKYSKRQKFRVRKTSINRTAKPSDINMLLYEK